MHRFFAIFGFLSLGANGVVARAKSGIWKPWTSTASIVPESRAISSKSVKRSRSRARRPAGVRGRAEEFVAPVDDIFRVWTTAQTNTPDIPEPPLTPAARAAYEDFDPLVDDPVLSCVAPGMPEAMTWIGPHPVEFVSAANGDIQIHVESDDVVRIVRMTADANTQGPPPSPLGYSVGRWEGDTLVVTTTRIDWPYFKIRGLVGAPQSDRIEIVERFELDRARGELAYNFTATDPVNYTGPITVERYHVWRYRPGTAINPYRCTL